jgi:ABC-type Zn uptake system ZnuABC Zn-binding protein ZnuA
MKNKKLLTLSITLLMLPLLLMPVTEAQPTEKPVIVCTTSAVGSVVEQFLGETAEVLVLVRSGLCPADFDLKPGYVEAINRAAILFKQGIPGEFWLDSLLIASSNQNLTTVIIPGVYNTPEGAKNYIRGVGGNLSQILNINLNSEISALLSEVDSVASWMSNEADSLQASNINIICMGWLKTTIEAAGFNVVATFNPPETLSAGDITALIETAESENVALVVDNLQIDVEFGEGIASEVGAQHLVLTNFPGAIPNTETLAKMLQYNAEQLFNATITWQTSSVVQDEIESLTNQVNTLQQTTADLQAETDDLANQLFVFQITTSLAVIIALAEAVLLITRRKRN